MSKYLCEYEPASTPLKFDLVHLESLLTLMHGLFCCVRAGQLHMSEEMCNSKTYGKLANVDTWQFWCEYANQAEHANQVEMHRDRMLIQLGPIE